MITRTVLIVLIIWFCSCQFLGANEKVTLQLRWDHQFQFAGYYAAKWQGFYKDAGLDVTIKSAVTPTGILSSIEEVSSGRAHFGIGAADILIARDKGTPLVVLASIFQHSASAFYFKKQTPFNSLADFLKLKVARRVNDLIDVELQSLLRVEGIDPDLITSYPLQPGVKHLISGKVDVLPGYTISFPFEAKEMNLEIKSIKPINYGVDFYGDSLFVNGSFIKQQQHLVESFTKASLKGWQYAMNNPEQIAEQITKKLTRTAKLDKTFAFNLFQSKGIRKLMNFPEVGIGNINPSRWERMHTHLKSIGFLKNQIDMDEFIFNPEKLNQVKLQKRQKIFATISLVLLFGFIIILCWMQLLRITVRKRTDELLTSNRLLKESEAQFRKIIEKSPLPVVINDKNQNITFVNDKFTECFGYNLDEISGSEKWWESAFPDEQYRSGVQHSWQTEMDKAFAYHTDIKVQEWSFTIKDRTEKICEFYMVPFKDISLIMMNDITERKKAEKELKRSRKHYYSLFNKNRDGYVINLGTGEILDPNPAFANMLGYSVDEVKKLSFWDLTPQKWVEWEVDVHGKKLLEKGYTDLYEKEYIHKNGTVFPIEVQAFLLNNPNDLDSAIIGAFVRDITKRKRVEDDLHLSEERFRSVAETAVDAIISINNQSKIIFWNKSAQSQFGYSAHEVLEKSINLIIPKKFQKDHYEGIKRILAGEPPKIIGKTVEVVGLKKNGTEFPIELSLAMWKTNKDLFFTAIIRDISERKMIEKTLKINEEKFRSLFENAPLAIVHLDKFGVITTCNENLSQILGASKDKIIGQDTTKAVKNVEMLNSITKSLSGHKSQYEGEYLSTTSGIQTPVRALYAPILSDNGDVTGVIGILEDITEQLKAEQNKLELESQLYQLQKNEAIGALAGGIAHDFNNILFPIVGFAEMLKEDLPKESDFCEHADVILTGAKRAKELVNQILTFSRQVEVNIQPLRPHIIIKEVAKLIRSTIPASIEIKKFIDPKAWTILTDPTQIHQVAMNLITNANYAMQEKGGVLTIRLQNIERIDIPDYNLKLDNCPHVLLSVSDTGTGMDDTTLEKIFNPYYTSKPKGKGTGLGLSVVYGIVKNYGGDISVSSSLDQGSTFDVYLPALKKDKISKQFHDSAVISGGDERILLVDDEKQVLRIEQVILERLGYKADIYDNSLEALQTINANPDHYDLIISDIAMPNLSGDQLTEKILKIKPTMPIVICTGFSERITLEKVMAIGAKALLMKPIIKSKLAATVREILDKAKEDAKDN